MSRLDPFLRWSPLQLTAGQFYDSRPAVLAFHGVDDPENFARLMDFVVRTRNPISIEDLDRAVHRGRSLPKRPVLVTFDDGHRSVLEAALPILTERSIPSVAFVVAGVLSTDADFWWSEAADLVVSGGSAGGLEDLSEQALIRHLKRVSNEERIGIIRQLRQSARRPATPRPQLQRDELRTLIAGGVAVGNHTWSHPCLNRCDAGTVRLEIVKAHDALSSALGEPPKWFAYPNGDWDADAETMLDELGYRLGFLFDHRMAEIHSPPFRMSRLRANSDARIDRFATILSGLHPAIHHARGRD